MGWGSHNYTVILFLPFFYILLVAAFLFPCLITRRTNKRGNVRTASYWNAFQYALLQLKRNRYYVFWVCVCSRRYTACKAHAPHCHLWPVQLYNIFPYCLINCTIFGGGKKFLNTKCVFWFSPQLLYETFLILRRTERDMIKNVYRSSCKVPVILARILMKLLIFWTVVFFAEYSNTKFHENLSSESRAIPCGQTDGQTWRS